MAWFKKSKKNKENESDTYFNEFENFHNKDFELIRKFSDAEDNFAVNYDEIKNDYTPKNTPSLLSAREEVLIWDKNLDIKSEINTMKVMDWQEDDHFLKSFQVLMRKIVRDNILFDTEGDLSGEDTVDALGDILELFSTINYDLFAGLISDSYCRMSNKKSLLSIDFYHILKSDQEEDLRALLKSYLSKKVALKKSCLSFDVLNVKAAQGIYKIHFQIKCKTNQVFERKAKIAQLRL
jgi:hypothetical protein